MANASGELTDPAIAGGLLQSLRARRPDALNAMDLGATLRNFAAS